MQKGTLSARRFFRAAAYFLSLFAMAHSAFAQGTTGAIDVTVLDNTGSVIPGSKLTAINTGTGAEYRTESDAAGRGQFLLLRPGTYRVTVEQQGFEKLVRDGVIVNATEIVHLDMKDLDRRRRGDRYRRRHYAAIAKRTRHTRGRGRRTSNHERAARHAEFHAVARHRRGRSRHASSMPTIRARVARTSASTEAATVATLCL